MEKPTAICQQRICSQTFNSTQVLTQAPVKVLVNGLEEGIQAISKKSPKYIAHFAELCNDIFQAVAASPNSNKISGNTNQHPFNLEKVQKSVQFTYRDITWSTHTLHHTSIHDLLCFLCTDIIKHSDIYPTSSLKVALNFLLHDTATSEIQSERISCLVSRSDETMDLDTRIALAFYILLHGPDYLESLSTPIEIISSLPPKFVQLITDIFTDILVHANDHTANTIAAAYVFLINYPIEEVATNDTEDQFNNEPNRPDFGIAFRYKQNYPINVILDAANVIISSSEDCRDIPTAKGAEHILTNSELYFFESVQSAVIYIIVNANDFSGPLFERAARHLAEYSTYYPTQFITLEASKVIEHNERFFKMAIKTPAEFERFFVQCGKEKMIGAYSKQLLDLFTADQETYPLYSGETLFTVKTLYNLWWACMFDDALSVNLGLAVFILTNKYHPAITFFKLHHDLMDKDGKQIDVEDYVENLLEVYKKINLEERNVSEQVERLNTSDEKIRPDM